MIRDENQPNSVNADLDTGILIDWMAAALQVTDQRENLESWFRVQFMILFEFEAFRDPFSYCLRVNHFVRPSAAAQWAISRHRNVLCLVMQRPEGW